MTDDAGPRAAKLPLWRTVRRAYALTWANLRSLGTVAMVWGPVVFVVLFAVNWATWPYFQPEATFVQTMTAVVPLAIASALLGATAAVAWHRHILLGEMVTAAQVGRFDARVWRYAGLVLGLSWVVFLPLLVIGGVVSFVPDATPPSEAATGAAEPADEELGAAASVLMAIIFALVSIPLALPVMRLLPVLPAVAVGEWAGMRAAWRATRGNSWRLLAGSLVTALPAIAFIFTGLHYEARFASSLWSAVNEVVWLVSGLVFVTFLSLAYRHFFPTGMAGGHTSRAD